MLLKRQAVKWSIKHLSIFDKKKNIWGYTDHQLFFWRDTELLIINFDKPIYQQKKTVTDLQLSTNLVHDEINANYMTVREMDVQWCIQWLRSLYWDWTTYNFTKIKLSLKYELKLWTVWFQSNVSSFLTLTTSLYQNGNRSWSESVN